MFKKKKKKKKKKNGDGRLKINPKILLWTAHNQMELLNFYFLILFENHLTTWNCKPLHFTIDTVFVVQF